MTTPSAGSTRGDEATAMRRDRVERLARVSGAVVLALLALGLNRLSNGEAPSVLALGAVIPSAWLGGLGPGLLASALTTAGLAWWMYSENVCPLPAALVRLTLLALEGALFCLVVQSLRRARRTAEAHEREARAHLAGAIEAQQRLRLVLDHAPAAVFMKDLDGRYELVNRGFIALTGRPAEKVVGHTDSEIWPAAEAQRFRDQDRQALQSGPAQFEDRVRAGSADKVFLTTKFPMIDCLGNPYAVCGLAVEITDRHRLETELRKARDDAEAANQAKDRFLAVLSHELRTPLTPVLVAVSGLLDGTIRDALRPTLEMIRRNIELESHLIDDLLDISQIVRGGLRLDCEPIDAAEVLRQALEICRNEIDRLRLRVELDLGAPRHHVKGDRARLLQLFWNLIHNAVKFSLDGGQIRIRSRSAGPSPEAPFGWLRFEFLDAGLGLSAEALERIFEPFEQVLNPGRARFGGLGLGLAIGRAIAQAHGGRVSATSDGLDRGACFLLELPLIAQPARPSPEPEPESDGETARASHRAGSWRILLVEDNLDTLRYLHLVLTHMGHSVQTASSLSSALDAWHDHQIDLVLSDIELPDGTGLELMRTVASEGSTPGIAMSGFGSEDDQDLSLDAGFALHLTKPLDTARLDQAIRQVMQTARSIGCAASSRSAGVSPA